MNRINGLTTIDHIGDGAGRNAAVGADSGCQFFEFISPAGDEADLGPLPRQFFGDRPANTAGRTSNDRHSIFERHVCLSSPHKYRSRH